MVAHTTEAKNLGSINYEQSYDSDDSDIEILGIRVSVFSPQGHSGIIFKSFCCFCSCFDLTSLPPSLTYHPLCLSVCVCLSLSACLPLCVCVCVYVCVRASVCLSLPLFVCLSLSRIVSVVDWAFKILSLSLSLSHYLSLSLSLSLCLSLPPPTPSLCVFLCLCYSLFL